MTDDFIWNFGNFIQILVAVTKEGEQTSANRMVSGATPGYPGPRQSVLV